MTNRKIAPLQLYHIYNRSVLKIPLFKCAADYDRFKLKIVHYKKLYPVKILAYCLMPNHFHFLIREPENPLSEKISNSSKFLQNLQNAYAKYFAIKYKHSGRVFQGVFKSKRIDSDAYLNEIVRYIHENPVRKKLVATPKDWPYSSARYLINL